MRRLYVFVLLALVAALGLGSFSGFRAEGEVSHLLQQKVGKGWDSPQRVPLSLLSYAVERNYNAKIEKIWPILGKGDRLAAYGIDLDVKPYSRTLWTGIPPATALIVSADLSQDAVLAEYHGAKIEYMFSCPEPEKLYLSHEIGIISLCGGKPMVGGKTLSSEVFSSVVEDRFVLSEVKNLKPKISSLWDKFLRASSAERVYFTEFDWVYPISVDLNGLHFQSIITGDPHSDTHGGPGFYWPYWGNPINAVGVAASYAKLVWYGEKWKLIKVKVTDARSKLGTLYCDKTLASRGLGLFIYPDGTCDEKVRTTVPETLISEALWGFYLRNEWFWQHHRYFNTGADVVLPYVRPYGRFRYENWTKPAWEDTEGWYRYLKERTKERAIMFADSLDWAPYGIPGSMTPWQIPCGWDEGKKLVCNFTPTGDTVCGYGACWKIPAGFTFINPRALRNWPGWLYPPRDYADLPPAMTFPTRVMAYQGDLVTIKAERVWDAEGEKVSYFLESPFPVVNKTENSFTIRVQATPRREYVIWVTYTDGVNRVRHPVFVYVFPTFELGGDNS